MSSTLLLLNRVSLDLLMDWQQPAILQLLKFNLEITSFQLSIRLSMKQLNTGTDQEDSMMLDLLLSGQLGGLLDMEHSIIPNRLRLTLLILQG